MEGSEIQGSLELTKDERMLIMDLMVHELFGQENLENLKLDVTSDCASNTTKEASRERCESNLTAPNSETVGNETCGTKGISENGELRNLEKSTDFNNAPPTSTSDPFENSVDIISRTLEKGYLSPPSSTLNLKKTDQSALISNNSVSDTLSNIHSEVSRQPNTELSKEMREIVIRDLVREFFISKQKKELTAGSNINNNDLDVNLSPDEEKILWSVICSKIKKLKFNGKTYNTNLESKVNLECDDNSIEAKSNYEKTPRLDEIGTQSKKDFEDDMCNLPTRPSSRRNSQSSENKDQLNNLILFDEVVAHHQELEAMEKYIHNKSPEKILMNNKCCKPLDKEKCSEMTINVGEQLGNDKKFEENNETIDLRSADSSIVYIAEIPPKERDEINLIGLSSDEEEEVSKIIMLAETEYKKSERNATKEKHDSYEREVDMFLRGRRKEMDKTENKVSESYSKTDNRVIGYADRLTDCAQNYEEDEDFIKMKWEINGDEFSVKASDNNLDVNTNQKNVTTKEELLISWQRTKKRKTPLNHTRLKTPMNEVGGPFYIDTKLVPTWIYHEGLMFKKWNPTQVVYEICSQCYWSGPEFLELEYSVARGFLFGVRVNDRQFISRERGHSKQQAKHCASARFLNFLGFKVDLNTYPNIITDFIRPNNTASWTNKTGESSMRKKRSIAHSEWEDKDRRRSQNRDRSPGGSCVESRTFRNYQAFRDYMKRNPIERGRSESSDLRDRVRHKGSQSPKSRTRTPYKKGQTPESRNSSAYKQSHFMEPHSRKKPRQNPNYEFEESSYKYIRSPIEHSCSLGKRKRDSSSSSNSIAEEHKCMTSTSNTSLDAISSMFDSRGQSRLPPEIMKIWLEGYKSGKGITSNEL